MEDEETVRVFGTVKDEQGAAIPKANVRWILSSRRALRTHRHDGKLFASEPNPDPGLAARR